MDQQQIQQIATISRSEVRAALQKANAFTKRRIYDPVTDINSPITGSSQQIGFFNTPKIPQPTTAGSSASFTANSGTAINTASTFDGYTLEQVVKALRNLGLLA